MGIFDRFKKKDRKNSTKSSLSELDLSHPIISKMVEWIEHPMELGKKPTSIKILDSRELFWPSQRKEVCHLLEYEVDDNRYIGFTGPITWTFFSVDLQTLSYQELYQRYTGWFIAFYSLNSKQYDRTQQGSNWSKFLVKLESKGFQEVEILQNVYLGGQNYYELSAKKQGNPIKLVGTESNFQERSMQDILPFYDFIGIGWDPLNIS